MGDFKDLFSGQAGTYARFRPTYPEPFIRAIVALAPDTNRCLDCGTGNGQAAYALSGHFRLVDAIDASAAQLERAPVKDTIAYREARAEATGYPDAVFDLITVGQAVHWFDLPAFHTEAMRLLKPGGILAVWGYGLLRLDPKTDALLDRFYKDVVGPYWQPERSYVEEHYRTLPFPWEEVPLSGEYAIGRKLDRGGLAGYLYSWSATQAYLKSNEDPIPALMRQLPAHWNAAAQVKGRHPLFWRIGRKG